MLEEPKGRRDHYLPQGYLRGFIDPARQNKPQPLWKLDIASKRWLNGAPGRSAIAEDSTTM